MSDGIRNLLEAERYGVLATLAARHAGWPFASLAPYALSATSAPLLLLSDLAEHTRNLRADPRASLLVHATGSRADPLAGARVTLLGRARRVPPEALDSALARYLERHPEAAAYAGMADFQPYVLDLTEARYVSGFGEMGWLSGERLSQALGG